VHSPLISDWPSLGQTWATAMGSPIIADTGNAAPAAAESEVMVRDLVGRIARLFPPVETGFLPAERLFPGT
jgi:hypothetical protein